jgi:hypothetical protein
MNLCRFNRLCSSLSAGAALVLAIPAAPLCAAPTNAPPWELPVPKSVFVDDIKIGRDPFFPHSSRRAPRLPDAAAETAQVGKSGSEKKLSDRIKLQGITGKVALINSVDFVAGQESEVRVPDGKLRIRCVSIHENSVVIQIQGDSTTRTLKLAD